MKKDKIDDLWMVLLLDKEKKTITVAAFDMDKQKAEASARERENPDAPMVCLNVTGNPDAFTSQLSLWLADNDIVGTENTETMRSIAKSMKEMMNSIERKHKPRNRRPLR